MTITRVSESERRKKRKIEEDELNKRHGEQESPDHGCPTPPVTVNDGGREPGKDLPVSD
ncbi:hypothetical protein [Ferrimonas kyonanensis]|uniref:hypothetical protein n=1 Tax=Ferrimonas kyonanensis TaxID=364763 RepID=UPI00042A5FAE|nr:hypothetical protein [Ferrimonas kyonanensis]